MITHDAKGKLTGYKAGKSIEMVRNPSWDPKTDVRPAYLEITERQAPPSPAGPVGPDREIRLPPARPRPRLLQTVEFGLRPFLSSLRARAEHGDVWMVQLLSQQELFVITSHPDHVESLFKAKPRDAPSLTGESPLRPILGPNSVLTTVGEQHMRQRKLLLPAFHGDAVQRYVEMIERVAEREIGPELVFNYIYAVFHSAGYRSRYAEFLRSDFPRVPLTSDYALFQELVSFGGHLVDLHAHKNGNGNGISFPVKGSNDVEEVRYQAPSSTGKDRHPGRVWINGDQYFENIAPAVWEFPIGGYLPAQRWLKDRIGRSLSFGDMTTYPRIIFALGETARLINEIDKSINAHGGWPKAFA